MMVYLPAVFVDEATMIRGAKEPRTRAGVAPAQFVVIPVTGEGVMTSAPGISGVGLVVPVGRVETKELTDAVADGEGTLASGVVVR